MSPLDLGGVTGADLRETSVSVRRRYGVDVSSVNPIDGGIYIEAAVYRAAGGVDRSSNRRNGIAGFTYEDRALTCGNRSAVQG
jgi:hypothetical protein